MLASLIDRLEALYGPQAWAGPRDPYVFVVWLNCGYPASDAACAKGFASVQAALGGVAPEAILAADEAGLARALKPGGMVPELRARRLKDIAAEVADPPALAAALAKAPPAEARGVLKSFPTLGEPAADRILLFCGLAPAPAVPTGALHVALRLGYGEEAKDWGKTYASVRDALEAEAASDIGGRQRTFLLLKAHGQGLCRRAKPRCADCPLKADCAYFREVVAPLSPG